ncbi:MAG: patatin-like phospholipase family protein, partial [Candidatus Cryptobacteroides sp.]
MNGRVRIFSVCAAFAFLLAQAVHAQTAPYNYLSKSVSPSRDSVEVAKMRGRMDSIRTHCHRPTVALVLSGGGAKGAAHVGVMHYLDSLKIPVDLVVGTSMGGLMGCMKALGYTSDQIDTLVRQMDWNAMMRDVLPRNYSSYKQLKYKERYQLSMPFYYLDGTGNQSDEIAPRLHTEIDIKDVKSGRGLETVRDNLLRSLPSGYVFGQNVYNLISSLTVGYQDHMNFIDLPIPYACVSTDIGAGKSKVWYDGPLNTALRSTMSIPGVFTPVHYEDMVLTDGGMRDNYPTAIAKYVGADIIIGVDVSAPPKDAASVRNIADVVSLSMDMLGRETYEYNVTLPDVNIRPDLMGLNMLSFSAENIDRLIHNGYEAARKQDSLLNVIKSRVGVDPPDLSSVRAVNLRSSSVKISDVELLGVGDMESRMLRKKLRINPGDTLTYARITDAIATVYATGAYDYVTYELLGNEEPYRMVINCRKGPVHQFGLGVRMDTEDILTANVNVGLFARRLQGSTLNLNAIVSRNPSFQVHYYYDSPWMPTVNLAASLRWTQTKVYDEKNFWPSVDFLSSRQELFLSGLKLSNFDIWLGIQNDIFYDNSQYHFLSAVSAGENRRQMNSFEDYMSLRFNASFDNMDDGYFPTRGLQVNLDYVWNFTDFRSELKNTGLHILTGSIKGVISAGKVFSFIPSVSL